MAKPFDTEAIKKCRELLHQIKYPESCVTAESRKDAILYAAYDIIDPAEAVLEELEARLGYKTERSRHEPS